MIFHSDCRSMIDEMKMMNDGLTMEWVNGMFDVLVRNSGIRVEIEMVGVRRGEGSGTVVYHESN